jgi:hypothetical protein
MALAVLSFHYVTTAFFLGVWLWYPLVLVIFFAIQGFFVLAGIGPSTDLEVAIFWGYQTAAVVLGILVAFSFKRIFGIQFKSRSPGLWARWIVTLIAFLAAQLFYARVPQQEFGLPFTLLATATVMLGMTESLLYEPAVFAKNRLVPIGGFAWWAFLMSLLQLPFFFTQMNVAQHWIALFAPGFPLCILFAVYAAAPPKWASDQYRLI